MEALDIETDTSELTEEEKAAGWTARGLVPAITPITSVGLHDGERTLLLHRDDHGGEEGVLTTLVDALVDGTGPVVTWNGSVFDMPFIADRIRLLGLDRLLGAFELTPDPDVVPKYEPLPGHDGGYAVRVAGREHVDLAYLVREDAADRGVSWSLKPYVKAVLGVEPVEVDRTAMHLLTKEEHDAYLASDAVVTWQLARHLRVEG